MINLLPLHSHSIIFKGKPSNNGYTITHIVNPDMLVFNQKSYYKDYEQRPLVETTSFGCKVEDGSHMMEKFTEYNGKGFSTPANFGGTWLKASKDTPLSTKGVHDCLLLNLVNDNTDEQFLYHIHSSSSSANIEDVIKDKFPRFTKINIMLGDVIETKNTLDRTLDAIDKINPTLEKNYYHVFADNPEVVAINGQLKYIPDRGGDQMTFKVIDND